MAEEETEQKELPKYTWEEVAKHRTAESLWVIIHDKVYDITKFMEEVSYCSKFSIITIQLLYSFASSILAARKFCWNKQVFTTVRRVHG